MFNLNMCTSGNMAIQMRVSGLRFMVHKSLFSPRGVTQMLL